MRDDCSACWGGLLRRLRGFGRCTSCLGCLCSAVQHLCYKLFVQAGGGVRDGRPFQRERVAYVVAAGAGIGGVIRRAGGGQHPLSAAPAGKAAVHRYLSAAVQGDGGGQGAVLVADVQGHGPAGPVRGQRKTEGVHPLGLLRPQMQPMGPGQIFGAAVTAGEDPDRDIQSKFLPFLVE